MPAYKAQMFKGVELDTATNTQFAGSSRKYFGTYIAELNSKPKTTNSANKTPFNFCLITSKALYGQM